MPMTLLHECWQLRVIIYILLYLFDLICYLLPYWVMLFI